jgi:hypothetical protein
MNPRATKSPAVLRRSARGMGTKERTGRRRASKFITDHCRFVSEFDLNPLICTGSDIAAVDALIVRAVSR